MAAESAIEQIKERVSLVDLVGQRVKLGKSGRNLKGLCPFHAEKTPSFYVFPENESYHCLPRTVHRMIAVTDVDVVEVSTPELDDVTRLEDDYGREGTPQP